MNSLIVHVVYECEPGEFKGGVQKVTLELASAQKKIGMDVEIWTLSKDENKKSIIYNDVPVKYFKPEVLFGVYNSVELIKSLENEKINISIIHSHNTYHPLNLQIGKFCRLNKIPVFYHPHGALDSSLFNGYSFQALKKKLYIKFFEAKNLKGANGVFALTENEKQQLLELGVDKNVYVLPNGIHKSQNVERCSYLHQRYNLSEGDRIFLFVGRVVHKKGLHIFLEAFAKLVEQMPYCYFFIAGDPQQNPNYSCQLKEKITEFGIDKNIKWLGFLSETKKPDVFNSADVFIHSSYSEGMAMAVLEAMSYGLPCIVTEGCYMSNAAKSGALIECKQNSKALFKAALDLISDDERLQLLRIKTIDYVRQNHNWLRIAEQTKSYYRL